jgi:hypothetical protein
MVYIAPKILAALLGLPIKVVEGYKGSAEVRLAVESGEVGCAFVGWESAKPSWAKSIESGDAVVILQLANAPHPDLPKVPLVTDQAKSDEDRKLIELTIFDQVNITRVYALPPRTPKERVEILRKGFMDTLTNMEFLSEAKRARVDINPVSVESLEKIAAGIANLNQPAVTRLKEIFRR